MTAIRILGAAGRMGQTLIRAARACDDLRVTAAVERHGHPALGQDAGLLAGGGALGVPITTPEEAAAAEVTIDFTFHAAVPAGIARAAAEGEGYVLGTTGLSPEESEAVRQAARRIPVVWAPNMSLGVNILLELVRRAAAALGDSYDVEIVEMHHRRKQDAPSGTAIGLAEAVAQGRGTTPGGRIVHGRRGITGERPRGEVAIHALRGGDVVGDHTVIFAADGERVELAHKASTREAFAAGALAAARWLRGRPPGIYAMRHVLGLE